MRGLSRFPALQRIAGRLWRRNVIDDIPPELARCEFGCRKPSCLEGEWDDCTRRKQRAAEILEAAAERQEAPD